jgi:hypothetical protein
MDVNEKIRLKNLYSEMLDGELLELLAADKNDFQDDEIYSLIIDEVKKRDLKIQPDEKKESAKPYSNIDPYKLVNIQKFSQSLEAHIMKSKLESEGIECFLEDDHSVAVNWLYSNAIGGVKLKVRDSDADNAQKIISRMEAGQAVIPSKGVKTKEICPHCDSKDIHYEKYARRAIFLSWLLLSIPLPFFKRKWKCNECSYEWKVKK